MHHSLRQGDVHHEPRKRGGVLLLAREIPCQTYPLRNLQWQNTWWGVQAYALAFCASIVPVHLTLYDDRVYVYVPTLGTPVTPSRELYFAVRKILNILPFHISHGSLSLQYFREFDKGDYRLTFCPRSRVRTAETRAARNKANELEKKSREHFLSELRAIARVSLADIEENAHLFASSEHTNQGVLSLPPFTPDDKLGSGSFGTAYKIKTNSGGFIVGKVQQAFDGEEPEWTNLLRLRTKDGMTPPNIISFLGQVQLVNGQQAMLVDLYDKDTLLDNDVKSKNRWKWYSQMCTAVKWCHERRVIHCDIKPENILIKQGKAYLSDFGSSFVLPRDRSWLPLPVRGTRLYFPPEISIKAVGRGMYGAFTDIWALGCLYLCMSTGTWDITRAKVHKQTHQLKQRMPLSALMDNTPQRRFIPPPVQMKKSRAHSYISQETKKHQEQ